MKDVFGRERTAVSSGEIASSEAAIITAGGEQALVQSVTCNYSQAIDTVTEIGKPNVYWVPGKSNGTINISKLVGKKFFEGWTGTTCGAIESLAVKVSGESCGFSGSGGVDFDGGMLESVGFNMTAQQMQITNQCTIRVASMSAS